MIFWWQHKEYTDEAMNIASLFGRAYREKNDGNLEVSERLFEEATARRNILHEKLHAFRKENINKERRYYYGY